VACRFGESIVTGVSGLTRISPAASRIADASPDALVEVGVPMNRASAIHRIARALADDELCLERASDPETAMHQLVDVCGIPDRLATLILMRALHWPDTFPGSDRTLQRAAGVSSANALQLLAERWRPWRRYAALHLYRHTVTSHPDSHN
jgi:AraC family transcriptional regulator of adaptative response / DNA-3-methyladenine glycosylase II